MIAILVTILLVLAGYLIFLMTHTKTRKIYFVGPHTSGKTAALLCLLGLDNKTVTTLSSHRIQYKDKEIFEVVPDDNSEDFQKRFYLNSEDRFVFFVKNEEEMDSFPECSGIDVTFVLWKKVNEREGSNLVYLQEDREKLKEVIMRN